MLLLAGSSRQPVGSGNCLFPPAAHAPGTRSFPTRHNPHSVPLTIRVYIYISSVCVYTYIYIVFNVVRHSLRLRHLIFITMFLKKRTIAPYPLC